MKTLYKNAKILIGNSDTSLKIINGEILVNGEVIEYIGENTKISVGETKVIDICGNLIIPGFKNAHTHSAMTFLRSYSEDLPLDRWLFESVFPAEAKLTENDVYILTKLACLEYFRNGITSVFDMYMFKNGIARAAADMGLRLVLCGASSGGAESIENLEEEFYKFNNFNSLVSFKLGFHAEYTSSEGLWHGIGKLAEKYKTSVYTHSSETFKEVNECIKKYGKTPIQLFDSYGLFEYGGAGFHSVHVSSDDIEIMNKKCVYAVINSASNLKLASGIADVEKLRKSGIKIAIGTDGAASNNALDMFREMYLTAVLAKYKNNDAASLPAEEVLKAAVSGGARCMGLSCCDSLEIGKKADFTVIDLSAPNLNPHNSLEKNLVYSGNPSNILTTVINGKTVYDKGKYFVGEDPADIIYEAMRIVKRITG